jgi:hypothetical protein
MSVIDVIIVAWWRRTKRLTKNINEADVLFLDNANRYTSKHRWSIQQNFEYAQISLWSSSKAWSNELWLLSSLLSKVAVHSSSSYPNKACAQLDIPDHSHQELLIHVTNHRRAPPSMAHLHSLRGSSSPVVHSTFAESLGRFTGYINSKLDQKKLRMFWSGEWNLHRPKVDYHIPLLSQ